MHSLDRKNELKSLLAEHKNKIDDFIVCYFNSSGNKLEEACQYALKGSGKRFRPCITLIVAELLGNNLEPLYAALAIELFHTASLIADDLPSMDDDPVRRDKPSLHKVFGENVALLTSYALIGEGYTCVLKNKEELRKKLKDIDQRGDIAVSMLARSNGCEGAPSGQYLDLFPPVITQESLDLMLYRKTVLFFETAFVLGWLFGGGELAKIEQLKKASYHFGMAFQIYDDFLDLGQDKEKNKAINYFLALGVEKSKHCLRAHIEQCKQCLIELQLYKKVFQELLSFLELPLYT